MYIVKMYLFLMILLYRNINIYQLYTTYKSKRMSRNSFPSTQCHTTTPFS